MTMSKNNDPRIAPTKKSGRGRPPGSKTRPDAPRMLAVAKKKMENAQKMQAEAQAALAAASQKPSVSPSPSNPSPKDLPTVHDTGSTPGVPTSQPDTDLFGKTPNFDRPPAQFAGAGNAPDPSPIPEPEPVTPEVLPPGSPGGEDGSGPAPAPEGNPESQRPLATMIWDSLVNMLAVFIGRFWLPRKQGDHPELGEIPYDEREMVVSSLCEYLHSIGMTLLSPGQKLALAITNYSSARIFPTLSILKERFAKRRAQAKPATPPGDTRFAESTPKPEETNVPPTTN